MTEQIGSPAPETPAEPSKAKQVGKSIGKRLLGYGIVLVVVAIGVAAYSYFNKDVTTAKVGDCITETVKPDASDAKVVDCTDAKAKNKVVGIVKDVPEADFDNEAKAQQLCAAYPTWENVIWVGEKGGKGDAWCLEPTA